MIDDPAERQARLRRRRPVTWVWVVPIVAGGIVAWLAWRSLTERGPTITIAFESGKGLGAKQSTIQHRGVVVGTIESLQLSSKLTNVIVHARMGSAVESALNEKTRFYVVSPRVGPEGISGLSTLVSGAYIEMDPGNGKTPQRHFKGLEDPPALHAEAEGASFVLVADDLGSLTRGAPISYRGTPVGNVDAFALSADGSHIDVTAFVRAPYHRLVHPQTRFWNAGGFDVAVDSRGVRLRANSWQQLLSGGIEFSTPPETLAGPMSPRGARFALYANHRRATVDPRVEVLWCVADFAGDVRGISSESVVELHGFEIGEVRSSELRYERGRRKLSTRVILAINPDAFQSMHLEAAGASPREKLSSLLADGLHAHVMSSNLLTGLKLVSLDLNSDTPRGRVIEEDGSLRIPTSAGNDLDEILANLKSTLEHLNKATGGPELGRSLKSLDATLMHLEHITKTAEPELQSLLKSMRETADTARDALSGLRSSVSGANANGDVSELLQELARTSRSVRELADYLSRHPESLLRGRRGAEK